MAPLLIVAMLVAAEPIRYRFEAPKELEEFEPVAGSWSVASGTLWCTTRGAREELRWRRGLTPVGSLKLKLVGAGHVGVALRHGREETLVRLDRGGAKVAVEADGKSLLERGFEPPATGPVELVVAWTLEGMLVRVGDDEPLSVARTSATSPFEQLALLSFHSHPRFDDLEIDRPGGEPPSAIAGGLTEEARLALERASSRFEGGDADGAFEIVAAAFPRAGLEQSPLPVAALELLQRLGTQRPALRRKPPLAGLVEAARTVAQDKTAEFTAPLRPGWTIEALPIRRTDGPVFELTCADPALSIEVVRYDQKLKYWFGSDPKLVYTTGGGGATLGRARADEQKERRAGAEFVRPFDKCELSLGGATTHAFELAWPDPADPARKRALRELFALHRGDTWCVSIEGAAAAFESARVDLDWILATFRFLED